MRLIKSSTILRFVIIKQMEDVDKAYQYNKRNTLFLYNIFNENQGHFGLQITLVIFDSALYGIKFIHTLFCRKHRAQIKSLLLILKQRAERAVQDDKLIAKIQKKLYTKLRIVYIQLQAQRYKYQHYQILLLPIEMDIMDMNPSRHLIIFVQQILVNKMKKKQRQAKDFQISYIIELKLCTQFEHLIYAACGQFQQLPLQCILLKPKAQKSHLNQNQTQNT
ncbi:unnamed protein product [Paramecium octaurelia]|uniref:Uncharacterized protein n=1 Tax=Paramecium octaurelia TaxID=43137 RepID=A0A8S1YKQ2_PAROT|nr:unnamed protein product [Paramecium octaurelia]